MWLFRTLKGDRVEDSVPELNFLDDNEKRDLMWGDLYKKALAWRNWDHIGKLALLKKISSGLNKKCPSANIQLLNDEEMEKKLKLFDKKTLTVIKEILAADFSGIKPSILQTVLMPILDYIKDPRQYPKRTVNIIPPIEIIRQIANLLKNNEEVDNEDYDSKCKKHKDYEELYNCWRSKIIFNNRSKRDSELEDMGINTVDYDEKTLEKMYANKKLLDEIDGEFIKKGEGIKDKHNLYDKLKEYDTADLEYIKNVVSSNKLKKIDKSFFEPLKTYLNNPSERLQQESDPESLNDLVKLIERVSTNFHKATSKDVQKKSMDALKTCEKELNYEKIYTCWNTAIMRNNYAHQEKTLKEIFDLFEAVTDNVLKRSNSLVYDQLTLDAIKSLLTDIKTNLVENQKVQPKHLLEALSPLKEYIESPTSAAQKKRIENPKPSEIIGLIVQLDDKKKNASKIKLMNKINEVVLKEDECIKKSSYKELYQCWLENLREYNSSPSAKEAQKRIPEKEMIELCRIYGEESYVCKTLQAYSISHQVSQFIDLAKEENAKLKEVREHFGVKNDKPIPSYNYNIISFLHKKIKEQKNNTPSIDSEMIKRSRTFKEYIKDPVEAPYNDADLYKEQAALDGSAYEYDKEDEYAKQVNENTQGVIKKLQEIKEKIEKLLDPEKNSKNRQKISAADMLDALKYSDVRDMDDISKEIDSFLKNFHNLKYNYVLENGEEIILKNAKEIIKELLEKKQLWRLEEVNKFCAQEENKEKCDGENIIQKMDDMIKEKKLKRAKENWRVANNNVENNEDWHANTYDDKDLGTAENVRLLMMHHPHVHDRFGPLNEYLKNPTSKNVKKLNEYWGKIQPFNDINDRNAILEALGYPKMLPQLEEIHTYLYAADVIQGKKLSFNESGLQQINGIKDLTDVRKIAALLKHNLPEEQLKLIIHDKFLESLDYDQASQLIKECSETPNACTFFVFKRRAEYQNKVERLEAMIKIIKAYDKSGTPLPPQFKEAAILGDKNFEDFIAAIKKEESLKKVCLYFQGIEQDLTVSNGGESFDVCPKKSADDVQKEESRRAEISKYLIEKGLIPGKLEQGIFLKVFETCKYYRLGSPKCDHAIEFAAHLKTALENALKKEGDKADFRKKLDDFKTKTETNYYEALELSLNEEERYDYLEKADEAPKNATDLSKAKAILHTYATLSNDTKQTVHIEDIKKVCLFGAFEVPKENECPKVIEKFCTDLPSTTRVMWSEGEGQKIDLCKKVSEDREKKQEEKIQERLKYEEELKKIRQRELKGHTEDDIAILAKFGIKPEDLFHKNNYDNNLFSKIIDCMKRGETLGDEFKKSQEIQKIQRYLQTPTVKDLKKEAENSLKILEEMISKHNKKKSKGPQKEAMEQMLSREPLLQLQLLSSQQQQQQVQQQQNQQQPQEKQAQSLQQQQQIVQQPQEIQPQQLQIVSQQPQEQAQSLQEVQKLQEVPPQEVQQQNQQQPQQQQAQSPQQQQQQNDSLEKIPDNPEDVKKFMDFQRNEIKKLYSEKNDTYGKDKDFVQSMNKTNNQKYKEFIEDREDSFSERTIGLLNFLCTNPNYSELCTFAMSKLEYNKDRDLDEIILFAKVGDLLKLKDSTVKYYLDYDVTEENFAKLALNFKDNTNLLMRVLNATPEKLNEYISFFATLEPFGITDTNRINELFSKKSAYDGKYDRIVNIANALTKNPQVKGTNQKEIEGVVSYLNDPKNQEETIDQHLKALEQALKGQ